MTRLRLVIGLASGLVVGHACSAGGGDNRLSGASSPASTVTTAGTGGGIAGVGGSGTTDEICDGIDNDSDDAIDEDCSCTAGETQECYPSNTPPPEGCKWGEQTCEGASWGACTGASLPPVGEDACCTELGNTPTHAAHDAFVAAYPSANMPKTWPAIEAFMPAAGDYTIEWTAANSGGELIDGAARKLCICFCGQRIHGCIQSSQNSVVPAEGRRTLSGGPRAGTQ